MNMKDLYFGLLVALYSLCSTRITVGLPLNTADDIINAFSLGVVSGIGGLIAFRANPSGSILDIVKSVANKP